jgi:regulator of replication initiation timing
MGKVKRQMQATIQTANEVMKTHTSLRQENARLQTENAKLKAQLKDLEAYKEYNQSEILAIYQIFERLSGLGKRRQKMSDLVKENVQLRANALAVIRAEQNAIKPQGCFTSKYAHLTQEISL